MKLQEQFAQVIARRGRAESTGEAYWHWVECYLRFHRDRAGKWLHPAQMSERHVEQFLTHLAVDKHVSPSTQNQAFSGLLFLYRDVLKIELRNVSSLRAKPCEYVPVVLSRREVAAVLDQMRGINWLIANVMYGGGLRVGEACELRIKDVDCDRLTLTVRQAKGKKDRFTLLPESLVNPISEQIQLVKRVHATDLKAGFARVPVPYAFARKSPNAESSLSWYFLFSAAGRSRDRKTGAIGRFHVDKSSVQRAIKSAAERAGLTKRVTSHTLRHSFGTHLLEDGASIETVRDLLGHDDIRTTQIYLHAVEPAVTRTRSPLERILARDSEYTRQNRKFA